MSENPEIETLRKKMEAERAKLLSMIGTLREDELFQRPEDGWSIKDMVAHIANAETVNVEFIRRMLEQDHPIQLTTVADDYPDFEGAFELDRYNAYIHAKRQDWSWAEAMAALERARRETLELIETLRASDLDRGGVHAVWGEQTVGSMLKILMLHDKMHGLEIGKRGQRKGGA